jgi:DNA-nicking Smr family endonuclease
MRTEMGNKERKHSNSEDGALFRDSVGEARPVNARKRHQPERQLPGRAVQTRRAEAAALSASQDGSHDIPEGDHSDELVYQRGNVTRRVMRDLRRGKFAVQEELDLHGLTRQEARDALQGFIEHCIRRRLRCVRIVHGKGRRSGPAGPVLKQAVNRWLRRWDAIHAFCPARDCDGGSGAVYVLLGD